MDFEGNHLRGSSHRTPQLLKAGLGTQFELHTKTTLNELIRCNLNRMKTLNRLSILLSLLAILSHAATAQEEAHEQTPKDSLYQKMIALKTKYPEGRRWTNRNSYSSKAGYGGQGCHAFALILSDAAFDAAPIRKHKNLGELKVGDMIRVNKNTHTVIVLAINEDKVTIAEGNYNKSVHWGRVLTIDHLAKYGNYILTRYPTD